RACFRGSCNEIVSQLPSPVAGEVVRASLRAFFEGSGLAAQMRENFAGKMERTSNQNWIWCLPGQSQSFINRSSDGGGECWRDGRKNFRYYVGISRAFASNFRQKNRLANRRKRFTDST